jgi:hypothetical protein
VEDKPTVIGMPELTAADERCRDIDR